MRITDRDATRKAIKADLLAGLKLEPGGEVGYITLSLAPYQAVRVRYEERFSQ